MMNPILVQMHSKVENQRREREVAAYQLMNQAESHERTHRNRWTVLFKRITRVSHRVLYQLRFLGRKEGARARIELENQRT